MLTTDSRHAATCTFALRFADGRYVLDPTTWIARTDSLAEAHLWIWPLDESNEAREARISAARSRMGHGRTDALIPVRAR